MDVIEIPAIVPVTTAGNLSDLPLRHAQQTPSRVTFATRDGHGGWQDVTARQFADRVDALAKGFIAAGLAAGDRLSLMARTSFEWTLVDFAAWTAGLVVVPVYETSSPEQLRWILQDSETSAVVVETRAHAQDLASVRAELPQVAHAWTIDDGGLDELARQGSQTPDQTLDTRRTQADRTSTATIIYTSGTTGRPKGCVLTHGNFMDLAENTAERLKVVVREENASTILFLPLAHVFARFIEIIAVHTGAKFAHSGDLKALTADFASFQPTFILSVPRVFEKIYNASEQKALADGKGTIFQAAARTATQWSEAQDSGGPGLGLRLRHRLFDALVYRKLRAVMGGRLRYAVSGGAPLSPALGHFFRGIGLVVLEGYGLTETTAPTCVNTPDDVRIGTVGRPLPGVGVRIADDGEILMRGNNVFREYHGNGQASADAFYDGWFRSGDLGHLDDDGFLSITGRKKEILVTAGGKNVAPAQLEDSLRANPLVSQCMVVGDRRPFVAALITLDMEMLPAWAKAHSHPDLTPANALDHPAVRAELDRAVAEANTTVSRAESIRKYVVLDQDFTEANGYLTPSLKLRRQVVLADFAPQVEKLYASEP